MREKLSGVEMGVGLRWEWGSDESGMRVRKEWSGDEKGVKESEKVVKCG